MRVPRLATRCILLVLAGQTARVAAQTESRTIRGTGLDVDLYSNIYVIDAAQDILRLYAPDRSLVREIGGPGWGNDQFDHPSGVWARNGIDVFVADHQNHRIQRFDRHLNFVSSFSTRDSDVPDDRFGYPLDAALSRLGELYICDGENSRIVKVNGLSQVERTFGGFGAGKGRLEKPTRVEVGPKDRVIVLDGSRVVEFDSFGNFIRELGEGIIRTPVGIFADPDAVAVMDSTMLYCFDAEDRPDGAFPLSSLVSPPEEQTGSFVFGGGNLYLLTETGLTVVPDPRLSRHNSGRDERIR